jgi:PncC family amidohydrolase
VTGFRGTGASEIALRAVAARFSVGVAESLTGGGLAVALAGAPGASEWFKGAVVAYQSGVKHDVLGVTSEHVVSAQCATEMANGAKDVLGADLTMATTGVAGPGRLEDQPPGTVFIAAQFGGEESVRELHLSGPPDVVVADTITCVIDLALDLVKAEFERVAAADARGNKADGAG